VQGTGGDVIRNSERESAESGKPEQGPRCPGGEEGGQGRARCASEARGPDQGSELEVWPRGRRPDHRQHVSVLARDHLARLHRHRAARRFGATQGGTPTQRASASRPRVPPPRARAPATRHHSADNAAWLSAQIVARLPGPAHEKGRSVGRCRPHLRGAAVGPGLCLVGLCLVADRRVRERRCFSGGSRGCCNAPTKM
jgi:hypothetical protein